MPLIVSFPGESTVVNPSKQLTLTYMSGMQVRLNTQLCHAEAWETGVLVNKSGEAFESSEDVRLLPERGH